MAFTVTQRVISSEDTIYSYLNKEHAMIEEIIRLKKRIMNSGIRVAA